jgi:hypothetical protein
LSAIAIARIACFSAMLIVSIIAWILCHSWGVVLMNIATLAFFPSNSKLQVTRIGNQINGVSYGDSVSNGVVNESVIEWFIWWFFDIFLVSSVVSTLAYIIIC